jgi:hypothetical protein
VKTGIDFDPGADDGAVCRCQCIATRIDFDASFHCHRDGARAAAGADDGLANVYLIGSILMPVFTVTVTGGARRQALVRMTGLSLKFVNNWLSNYRVRVWRPAMEGLDDSDSLLVEDTQGPAADADADADAAAAAAAGDS